jgi:MFS family permease
MIATALAALGAWLVVPESPVRTPGRLPALPALLMSVCLISLLLALSRGNSWGWVSVRVLGLFAISVIFAAAWIGVENRVQVPIIDMKMMRLRGVWTSNLVAACVGFGMYASFGFLPQLLQTPPEAGYGFGATVTESGRLLLPWAVGSFLVGFVTARLVRLLGARIVIGSACLLNAGAFASIALFHGATWQLYASTTILGVAMGLVVSSLAGVVIASVSAEQTGVASGMNANIRTIGGCVGAAVMSGVVTARLGPGGLPVERGYVIGFAILALCMLLAIAASVLLPDIHDQPTHDGLEDADNASLGMIPSAPALHETHGAERPVTAQ